MAAKPVYLGGSITVNDITFLVLEIPWDNNKDIAFTNPNPFLNLTFNPPETCDTV